MDIVTKEERLAKYKMELKGDKLILTGEGLFNVEIARSYIDDLKKIITKVDTKNVILVVDTSKLKASGQDVNPLIEEVSNLYKVTAFKKKYLVMPSSCIAGMQLKRRSGDGVFDCFEIVESLEKAK